MPFLIAALGVLAAVYFFIMRARNAAHLTTELMDVANDVRLAARRFGFVRRGAEHPAESIDDPNIALAALGTAFLELDDLPSKEQRIALTGALARAGRVNTGDAEELLILGRWIMNECGGPAQAVPRLGKKLYKMQGAEGFQPLMDIVQGVANAGSGDLSAKQREALDDLTRAFRLS
ncbi:hypothetical protein [Sagittula sp. S175]|uniref:hypothetical protein n=1 Tax=Sagittula sp. S175 TaxID=3415129 RepID=UPI003C7D4A9F